MKNINLFFYSFLILIIASCEGAFEEVGEGSSSEPVISITLSVSSESVAINSEVTFKVLSDNNDNITSSCKFFVNDIEIVGNKYTPGEEASYTVYANYNALKSNVKTFSASVGALKTYKTNVLMEDITGTWCGWCPRPAFTLSELKKVNSQVIVVAVHGGSTEPMYYPKLQELLNSFGNEGTYPWVQLNRKERWNEGQGTVPITSVAAKSSKVGLAIESSISERDLTVKLSAKFSEDFVDLKYVVYIIENDLIYDQRNYADLGYGSDDPLVGFEHDHVLRKALTSTPLGDDIDSGLTKKGSTFEKSLSYTIPDAYNKDKMEIVAFIIKDKSIVNARQSEFGKTQSFEEL